jgi:adenylate cyclase
MLTERTDVIRSEPNHLAHAGARDSSIVDRTSILIVDDNADSRELLRLFLQDQHQVTFAMGGQGALNLLRAHPFDLLLLDITMPEMDGFQVLEQLKQQPLLRHVPVIVISALSDMDSVVRCIELGAEDFLTKPFNAVLLKARVGASLEKKRLRDKEEEAVAQLQKEQQRSEQLLNCIFPKPIAERLKTGEVKEIAESFADVTVLFAGIHNFSKILSKEPPQEVVRILNRFFSAFDHLAEERGVEKIKTNGDVYMAAAGLPMPRMDHADAIAELALDMQRAAATIDIGGREPLSLRIGIHTGPVVAGVIGTSKFAYDVWGETVITASHMESLGLPGAIQASSVSFKRLSDKYSFERRGAFYIKGAGEIETYLLTGRKHAGH